nr:Pre-mRNA-splicing factor like [Ipomoea batatas]
MCFCCKRTEESNHPIGASFLGIISALALHFRHRQSKRSKDEHLHNFLAPLLERSDSGRAGRVERFSIYVVRQMGFKEGEECHQLRELAQEYLKRSKGCQERIFEYFGDDPNAIRLGEKLVEELDILIYSYFAFHWSKVPEMICQVLSVDVDQKKFKDAVMAATR